MDLMTPEQGTAATQSLKDKVSLVTGSTSGIGLGIARALAAAGSAVVLNGFGDPDAIDAEQNAIAEEFGVPVTYSGADMSKPEDIEEMFKFILGEFGAIDVLVNNAGIQHVEPLETFPVAKWDAILAINLSSAFHTTRLALPGMVEKGWGRIINVASAHGLIASPFKSAYVAAKHGMVGLTKVTALEAAEKGITCNAICPGYVYTPLVEKQIGEQAAATASRAKTSSATFSLQASPTSASRPSRNWAASRSSSPRTRPPRSPAPPSPPTAAGRHTSTPTTTLDCIFAAKLAP